MLRILEPKNHKNGKDFVIEETNECWICVSHKSRQNTIGYIPYKGTYAHRYFYEKFKGKIPDKLLIRHLCNNPKCCNPEHLEIGTHKDNCHDMLKSNRQRNGSGTELTVEQIELIAKDERSSIQIANDYKIHHSTVSRIKNGSTHHFVNKENYIFKKHVGKKLNEKDVMEIYNSDLSIPELAIKFNVSKRSIYDILNGKVWSKITKHNREDKDERI